MHHSMIFYDGPLQGKKMVDLVEYEKGKCRDIFEIEIDGVRYKYYLIQETEDKFCYSLLKKKGRNRINKVSLKVIK